MASFSSRDYTQARIDQTLLMREWNSLYLVYTVLQGLVASWFKASLSRELCLVTINHQTIWSSGYNSQPLSIRIQV
ncbi:hypothetical protein BJX76DRAFT_332205 [Aspergillus varians]